jgi:arylsulfatase A-like enzyme
MKPLLILLLAVSTLCGAQKPNIIFILVDDLGKKWVSCYGAEDIKTPHIDKLAKDGMLFHNVYSMPQCTPSRVTLLTGQYPQRHGWVNHWDVPRWGARAHFDPSMYPSLGKVMKSAGYSTCVAGKWQIDDFRIEPRSLAEAGFDQWCMWTGGEGGNLKQSSKRYWDPYIFQGDKSQTHIDKFGPDLYAQFIFDFITNKKDESFFIYWPMALTHGPLVHTPLNPDARSKMDKHIAMVRYTDHLVKQLRDHLEKHKLSENTLVIFTTDNGTSGSISGRRNGTLVRGGKTKLTENGISAPFIACWPAKIKPDQSTQALVDFSDILPTFAEMAGIKVDAKGIDGISFLSALTDPESKTGKTHILALGSHPAKLSNGQVIPALAFKPRSIRNQRWKVQVDKNKQISHLHDLKNDCWEKNNLIDSKDLEPTKALGQFQKIIDRMPAKDAIPRYRLNPVQAWDKKPSKK